MTVKKSDKDYLVELSIPVTEKLKDTKNDFQLFYFGMDKAGYAFMEQAHKLLQDPDFNFAKTLPDFDKEERRNFKYVAENWETAKKLKEEKGYWYLNKKGENVKSDFTVPTMGALRKYITRFLNKNNSTPKTYQSEEKLIDHIVEHINVKKYEFGDVVKACAQLLGYEIDPDVNETWLNVPPLASEEKEKKTGTK